MSWVTSLLAHEAVGGHGSLHEVVLDGADDALVGAAAVRGVVPSFDGNEDAAGELTGQALRHGVGGCRVVGGADDDDGGGTLRGNARALACLVGQASRAADG